MEKKDLTSHPLLFTGTLKSRFTRKYDDDHKVFVRKEEGTHKPHIRKPIRAKNAVSLESLVGWRKERKKGLLFKRTKPPQKENIMKEGMEIDMSDMSIVECEASKLGKYTRTERLAKIGALTKEPEPKKEPVEEPDEPVERQSFLLYPTPNKSPYKK